MLVQDKDQNFKLLVALRAATSPVVLCRASRGVKLARDFQGGLESKEDFLQLAIPSVVQYGTLAPGKSHSTLSTVIYTLVESVWQQDYLTLPSAPTVTELWL